MLRVGLLIVVLASLTACPDSSKMKDSSFGLKVYKNGETVEADFSCLRKNMNSETDSMIEWTIAAEAFAQRDESGNPILVPDLSIQVFLDNVIPESSECNGCTMATSIGNGFYTFEAPEDRWIAYRVQEFEVNPAGPPIIQTHEVNFEMGEGEAFNVMYEPVLEGLYNAVGVDRLEERTLAVGRLLDCNGDKTEGATVSLLDANGELISDNPETLKVYFDEYGPNLDRMTTSSTGQWSVANILVSTPEAYVQLHAPDGTLVACELIPLSSGAYSVVRMRPLRKDVWAMCMR